MNYSDMEVTLRFIACGMIGVLLKYSGSPQVDKEKLAVQLQQILLRGIPEKV